MQFEVSMTVEGSSRRLSLWFRKRTSVLMLNSVYCFLIGINEYESVI